jgi:sigma-54 dependent transcriptional regulator, acetoin dehydrogenase operon transcriptional activator AcoR
MKKDYVVRSHSRCREYNISVDRVYSSKILSENELAEKNESSHDLMITARPFMDKLYGFVKGSNFFSLLTDQDGCILSIIGDEDILSEASSFKMIPGAYMDEQSIGTNAMGTCLVEKGPVQISGDDHYIKVYHRWTCSAAPICNAGGEIIGSLDLTGFSENVHLHTLGMVVAAVHAIEKMLEIGKYAEELSMAKLYTEAVIDSIPAGIMTTDIDGNVVTVNKYISEMFGYDAELMKQMKIWNLFDGWDKVKHSLYSNTGFLDEDVDVNAKTNKLQFNLSAYPITDHDKSIRNIILIFREVKKVRKLANKIMGRRAIYTFDKIIGKDENFLRAMDFAKKIADSRSNILITGESGTGKELFAQSIHNYGNRKDEAFIALNCGAIPRDLIESELFGYDEGAFTGAKRSGQPGKFEIADGGSIFLDEIGEMPMDMQTRLLRVIEEGTVSRIGSVKEFVVDVRVIAASNKDLGEEVRRGNFRNDLFYRLNVLPLVLPPLRERKKDIPMLIGFFIKTLSKKMNRKAIVIPGDYLQAMIEYEWPGNVRELENMVEWMINTESFPERFNISGHLAGTAQKIIPEKVSPFEQSGSSESMTLEEMEKQHILRVLNQHGGNISLSSKMLGIGRSTLYRKMESLGIASPEMTQCPNSEHSTSH